MGNNWNVEKVNNMSYMFYHAKLFQSHLNYWKVPNESSVVSMFTNAHLFPLESIRDWNSIHKEQYLFYYHKQQQEAWEDLSSFPTKSSCLNIHSLKEKKSCREGKYRGHTTNKIGQYTTIGTGVIPNYA